MKRLAMLLVAGALLAACGDTVTSSPPTSTGAATSTSLTPTTGVTSTTTAAPAPPVTTAPVTSPATPAPTDAAPTTGAPVTTQAPGNNCQTTELTLTLGDTDSGMGNQYTPLVFTNSGTRTCTLDGHPGVSFVDADGDQIGDSAERVGGSTPTVELAPGAQAHAVIDYHDPGLYDDCSPVQTTSLKVYPPDEYDFVLIPWVTSFCSVPPSEAELTIDVVEPGAAPA